MLFAVTAAVAAPSWASMDLHSHSYCSNGTKSPETLVQEAKDAGLAYYALTDHDSVACLAPAARKAAEAGLRFVPGIEISAEDDTIHILGLRINPEDPGLAVFVSEARLARIERAHKILARLAELGISLDIKEDLLIPNVNLQREREGQRPLTAEAARAMTEDQLNDELRSQIDRRDIARGYVSTVREAFQKYMGDDAPAEVPMTGPTFKEAIAMIHAAGGIAVMAHPHTTFRFHHFPRNYSGRRYADFESLSADMLDAGLDGFEIYHSGNEQTQEDVDRVMAIVKEREQSTEYGSRLFLTPGSDYHGGKESDVGPDALGGISIPDEDSQRLIDRLGL